jgi:RecQ family ATP-dependent DNA helicase
VNQEDFLLGVLRDAADGLSRTELLARLREQLPHLQPADVESALASLGERIGESDGRIRLLEQAPQQPAPPRLIARFVAFDLESIVRPIVREPYLEQHVFQIGAVRFGPDAAWVAEAPEFECYCELAREDDEQLIYSDVVRERYQQRKQPLAVALGAFREFCSGAGAVVAYNGVAHDFRLIENEFGRCQLPGLLTGRDAPRPVDGLYLAQALWPIPPRQHRLGQLIERLELDVAEMSWHDALDDSRMLVELLEHGAREFLPTLGEGLLALVAAASAGSDAWDLLFALAGGRPAAAPHDHAQAARAVLHAIAAANKQPLRPEPGSEPTVPAAIELPAALLDETGTSVSLERLITAVKGDHAETRDAQRIMVARLREWLERDVPALVEAPTGTGKSYAILAAALDWLAADPRHKVVISTYTKQLQSQLAADIEALSAHALPALASAADMVKGAANRLSVRSLLLTLTELTEPDAAGRRRGRGDHSADQRYRDLVIFLVLRFIAQGTPIEEWESRSVDSVDVPAFFDEYCPRRLALYLASLSQSEGADYFAERGGIARYTQSVREALETRRLVIANHALLLAHLDDFEGIGEHTLLFVDEAHELENAATDALSATFDSGALAELTSTAGEWAAEQSRESPGVARLVSAVVDVERYLEDERLARAAMNAFDTAEIGGFATSLRTVTVASPLQGDSHVREMEALAGELRHTRRVVGLLSEALREIARNPPGDPYEHDRFERLWSQSAEIDIALGAIMHDVDAVLAPVAAVAPYSADEAEAAAEADARAAAAAEESEQLQLARDGVVDNAEQLIAVEDGDEDDEGEEDAELQTDASVSPSNRVVWAEELEELRPGRVRWYRFRLSSSPIELSRERDWARFRARFARSYYVSATLRVAGRWTFIRQRLGFGEDVMDVALDSPFNVADQAQLVCFEDFPSWSEHAEAAMHTVAHQTAGYARELVAVNGEGGAMILTTARATAAGIFDWLARLRVADGSAYPLISAGVEGNQRAVETFKSVGGLLVGTRGLWQGVDIADPRRLRLVWINKLPFAPFGAPVIAARLALEVHRAEALGVEDPDAWANEHYYLPLAAIALRQAVGRLIRTREHRGVIVISDRKLAGPGRLRRLYRQVFLGSLDPGLMRTDAETGEEWLGNVASMREGWRRIFEFYADEGLLGRERARELCEDEALLRFTELPQTLAILEQELSDAEERAHRQAGTLGDELVARAGAIAGHLHASDEPLTLKDKQVEGLRAIAAGQDLLGVLPTGYGKSYLFQLPALALPGVTVVVSPLVSLMTDQALELNRTIAGRVRALVAPMRESNSRTGKSEIEEQLKGLRDHGIKLVYLSPERLCQRHFQEWLRAGVRSGVVRRIALDEAHTFVQWGDDFRPSLRRAEVFLRALKEESPALQLIALTATANDSVREGLRSAIFALASGEERESFAFVRANPLRPELALYRRALAGRQGGPMSIAGLVERIVDSIDGHAIFYCLTVRQVDTLYAHLYDYLQGHTVDVMRYHGRLTDAEKTAVASHFKQAPAHDEEGYRRMVVIATSAFGLGVDRSDIRAVFCVSPPTDLAALYQQLGRAGRDRAARPGHDGAFTAGLAITYPRAQRTITFMTQQRVADDMLARIAAVLLNSREHFSSHALACDLVDEDLRSGRLSTEEAAKPETVDTYQTAILRVLAELSRHSLVRDLGDFPHTIEIRRGDYPPDTPELAELVEAIAAELPLRGRTEMTALHAALRDRFPTDAADAGALWHALLELHTLGYLDVSQRANREQLTGIEVVVRELPEHLLDELSSRHARVAREVMLLRDWFGDRRCANEGLRDYFAAPELPAGTCASDDCRCSSCWSQAGLPADAHEPPLLEAFQAENLRPASATTRGRRRSEEQLDRLVVSILWQNYSGLVENIILALLRGEDHYYSLAERRRKRLWPRLLLSRARGRKPALQRDDLAAAIARLVADGELTQIGASRYRLTRYVQQEAARASEQPATR